MGQNDCRHLEVKPSIYSAMRSTVIAGSGWGWAVRGGGGEVSKDRPGTYWECPLFASMWVIWFATYVVTPYRDARPSMPYFQWAVE